MIEHPFQINITVLNKCTSIPGQAHQTSPGSQKQAVRSYSFKGNKKKDARAGGLHSSGVQEERAGEKGRNREDTRPSAEDISGLAPFTEMTQKTSKPNDSAA